jgi:hypothetical protein
LTTNSYRVKIFPKQDIRNSKKQKSEKTMTPDEKLSDMLTIILALIFMIIVFVKKRRQVGKLWSNGGSTAIVEVENKKLQCTHCGHDHFRKREGLLATTWVAFFHFTFWNESARCFVCTNCGFVHWFLTRTEKADLNP